jgi:hypothetical protein
MSEAPGRKRRAKSTARFSEGVERFCDFGFLSSVLSVACNDRLATAGGLETR